MVENVNYDVPLKLKRYEKQDGELGNFNIFGETTALEDRADLLS